MRSSMALSLLISFTLSEQALATPYTMLCAEESCTRGGTYIPKPKPPVGGGKSSGGWEEGGSVDEKKPNPAPSAASVTKDILAIDDLTKEFVGEASLIVALVKSFGLTVGSTLVTMYYGGKPAEIGSHSLEVGGLTRAEIKRIQEQIDLDMKHDKEVFEESQRGRAKPQEWRAPSSLTRDLNANEKNLVAVAKLKSAEAGGLAEILIRRGSISSDYPLSKATIDEVAQLHLDKLAPIANVCLIQDEGPCALPPGPVGAACSCPSQKLPIGYVFRGYSARRETGSICQAVFSQCQLAGQWLTKTMCTCPGPYGLDVGKVIPDPVKLF